MFARDNVQRTCRNSLGSPTNVTFSELRCVVTAIFCVLHKYYDYSSVQLACSKCIVSKVGKEELLASSFVCRQDKVDSKTYEDT